MTHNKKIPRVDAHCHIDLYKSPQKILDMAEKQHIYTLAVTNAPSVFHYTFSLTKGCQYVRPAVGLHPQLVKTRKQEIERMWSLLRCTRYVGEVGLDYTEGDQTEHHIQKKMFESILEKCAAYKDKIITIHSRNSASDVISIIGDRYPGKIILHWYSGQVRELKRAVNYGMYFSINPAMVRTKKGQGLISKMPMDRIITETDGPFTNISGNECTPKNVDYVISALSKLWNIEPEETAERVLSNFRAILTD